jgi:hypothetical protein
LRQRRGWVNGGQRRGWVNGGVVVAGSDGIWSALPEISMMAKMRLSDPQLYTALETWRSDSDPHERAKADNLWFEERVSAARLAHFEDTARGADTPEMLARRQTDYWDAYVKNDRPDTFQDALGPARLAPGSLDTAQRIIRLEQVLDRVRIPGAQMTPDEVRDAFDAGDDSAVDRYLAQWNAARDGRPAFAAWKDEVRAELLAPDWADALRDRLGLAHYNPAPSAIPVVLMEYTVGDVLLAAASSATTHAIVSPTVLDGGPWPWFFPSPAELAYGRTMPLPPSRHHLLVELLHVKMPYRHNHIARFGAIRKPIGSVNMRDLRNRHLAALRLAGRRPDFGEEIP